MAPRAFILPARLTGSQGYAGTAVISVYGSLAGTAWSATPLMSLVLDKDTDPNSIDFVVTGVYQFRIGVKRSGTADPLTSADLAFPPRRAERLIILLQMPPIWNLEPGLVARLWRGYW